MTRHGLRIDDIIEANPMGRFQRWILLLCTLVIVFDGFDVLAIAFAAPAVSVQLGIAKSQLGYLFSSGLLGMTLGALILGPVGDKIGRRRAVIASVAIFGLFTLLTGFADSLALLLLARFLTGLGLGGAMPNATALITEYVADRHRNLVVAVIFLGMPLGGILGGLIAGQLIPALGWPSIFFLGGLAPLALVPMLMWRLPESPRFLIEQARDNDAQLRAIAAGIEQRHPIPADATFTHEAHPVPAMPVKALFTADYARDTLLLWLAYFCNLMVVYFLFSWIPTLWVDAGYALSEASRIVVIINLGGAIAPFVIAWLIRRFGSHPVLTGCFLLGALTLIGIGLAVGSLATVLMLSFLAGLFIIGGQTSLNGFASFVYPTQIRSTGVGWAIGVGRMGSVIGPLVVSLLVALGFAARGNFVVFGCVTLVTGLAIFLIRRHEAKTSP